jgi:ketosteroid isomerase-like protein
MSQSVAEKFMQELQRMEQSHDAAEMVALFGSEAELSTVALEAPLRGQEGAQEFWQSYLRQFDHIHSEFTEVSEMDGKAVLEWQAEGALRGGKPITYRGVTLLDTDEEQVQRFRSYYDSAAFVHPQPV